MEDAKQPMTIGEFFVIVLIGAPIACIVLTLVLRVTKTADWSAALFHGAALSIVFSVVGFFMWLFSRSKAAAIVLFILFSVVTGYLQFRYTGTIPRFEQPI